MKNFILWNYERGTWQYDLFCLLIVAFIFLTPKAWFEKREKLATQTARPVVIAEAFSLEKKFSNQKANQSSEGQNADGEKFHETATR